MLAWARTTSHTTPPPTKRLNPPEALRVLDLLRPPLAREGRLEDRTFLEPEGGEVSRLVEQWRRHVRRSQVCCADIPDMAETFALWGLLP